MTDMVDNRLLLAAPISQMDALLADLEGPASWSYPYGAHSDSIQSNFGPPIEITAQQQVALAAARAAPKAPQIAAFRAHSAIADRFNSWPEFLPVSAVDLDLLALGLLKPIELVPLSFARLAPWRDRAEFDQVFPGCEDAKGLWTPEPTATSDYRMGDLGVTARCRSVIGVKWTPSEVELEPEVIQVDADPARGLPERMRQVIRYQTPWSPVSRPERLLSESLARHGAQALLIWGEDCQFGFQLMAPGHRADGLAKTFGRDPVACEAFDRLDLWTLVTSAFASEAPDLINYWDPISTGAEGRGRVGRGSFRQTDA